MAQSGKIIIFDTTLRDGEQSPGCSMITEEKLRLLQVLEELHVDVIEAGYPASSRGNFESVEKIAESSKESIIAALCRARADDIETAWNAVRNARRPRIHTFISTSDLHIKYKLQSDRESVLQSIKAGVTAARKRCDDVQWSAEDASRSDIDFLCRCVETAISAGATTINLPDTVGYALPDEYGSMVRNVIERVPNSDKAVFSVHCHNDLGLAVANTLAGLQNGARQAECTLNGIGERAGNAALEEIVMALKVRHPLLGLDTGIDTTCITKASRLLSATVGFGVQPNKAIVGRNAFAHESGIHQDGMLKNKETYEIMTPESVGQIKSSLILGKHSGRHALKTKLVELGYDFSDNDVSDLFERFKSLADSKKEVFDDDIIALAEEKLGHAFRESIQLKALTVNCGTAGKARVTLSVLVNGTYTTVECTGNGPVDAIFKSIKQAADTEAHLQLYQVHAVTGGTDAQAEVSVRLEKEGRTFTGQAADPDTLTASARAYIYAINKII